jgi:hypothetical protein
MYDFGKLSPFHHVRLISRVYPPNPTEKSVPRPNKLATLIFYASTKPAKLVKVGRFLQQKIKVDVFWKKHGYNKISIDILEGLLSSCGQYLEFLVVDFLQMVLSLLSDEHSLLVSNITAAFVTFCEQLQSLNYSVDDEFFEYFNPVVERYSHFCQFEDKEDHIHKYEFRLAGLKAIQAAAMLETFTGIGLEKRLRNIWTGIVSNIGLDQPLRIVSGT